MSQIGRGIQRIAPSRCSAWCASTRTASAHRVVALARPEHHAVQRRCARAASISHARAEMYWYERILTRHGYQATRNRRSCVFHPVLCPAWSHLQLAGPSAPDRRAAAQHRPPRCRQFLPRRVSAASAEMGVMLHPAHHGRPLPSTNAAANPPALQASFHPVVRSDKPCAISVVSAQVARGTPPRLNQTRFANSTLLPKMQTM